MPFESVIIARCCTYVRSPGRVRSFCESRGVAGRCSDEKSPDKRRFLSEADSLHPGRTIGFDKRAGWAYDVPLIVGNGTARLLLDYLFSGVDRREPTRLTLKWPEESARSQVKVNDSLSRESSFSKLPFEIDNPAGIPRNLLVK